MSGHRGVGAVARGRCRRRWPRSAAGGRGGTPSQTWWETIALQDGVPRGNDGSVVTERHRLDRNRELWSVVNEQFTDADAEAKWSAPEIRWGLFRAPGVRVRFARRRRRRAGGRARMWDGVPVGVASPSRGSCRRRRPQPRPAPDGAALPASGRPVLSARRGQRRGGTGSQRHGRPRGQRVRRQPLVRPRSVGTGSGSAAPPGWAAGVPHKQRAGWLVRPRRFRGSRVIASCGPRRTSRQSPGLAGELSTTQVTATGSGSCGLPASSWTTSKRCTRAPVPSTTSTTTSPRSTGPRSGQPKTCGSPTAPLIGRPSRLTAKNRATDATVKTRRGGVRPRRLFARRSPITERPFPTRWRRD